MKEQISFLPEIDRKETQKKVEEVLESVRIYKQIGFVRREMKVTPAYTLRYHGQTYSVGNPAEEAAIWNAEKEQEIENLENNYLLIRGGGPCFRGNIKAMYLVNQFRNKCKTAW
jgi:ArpU family phage transcriptional regulator